MRRTWVWLTSQSPFVRCLLVGAALSVLAGAVWGFVRGVDYPSTVVFAVIEGAVLVGVPGTLVALLLGGLAELLSSARSRSWHRRG